MSFTARRVSIGDSDDAFDGKLIVRREEVARLREVEAIVDRARRTAFSIVKTARKTAKIRELHSIAARRARKEQAEREFVNRAAALEAAYRLAQASLTAQLEATLDHVLAAALARVGAQLPAAQRLRIVCEQLSEAAGPIPGARLRLCPTDEAIYRGAGIGSPWPADIDDTLKQGCCRLVADHGEWALDFDALMASLGPNVSLGVPSEKGALGHRAISLAEFESADAKG